VVTAKTGSRATWDGTFCFRSGRGHSQVIGSLFPYLFASIQQKTLQAFAAQKPPCSLSSSRVCTRDPRRDPVFAGAHRRAAGLTIGIRARLLAGMSVPGHRMASRTPPHRRTPRSPSPPPRRGRRRGGDEPQVQRVVREVGSANYPMLTRTNYVEWAVLMQVMLEARYLWEAVSVSGVDRHDDCMVKVKHFYL